MARALALSVMEQAADGDGVRLTFACLFYGPDVAGGADLSPVSFRIGADDGDPQMRAAFAAAVLAEAVRLGYPLAARDVRIPAVVRGG